MRKNRSRDRYAKGEVLGLIWKYVDLQNGRIQVVQQYTQDGEHKPPKSKAGYKGLCFHELRHTQATLLIGSGCDIKTVQHRLGHADVETTINTYSHSIDANDIAAANIIAGLKS